MKETAGNIAFEHGETALKQWEFDGIRLTHTVTTYKNHSTHSASNDRDAVRLHFGLKGSYDFTYKQLGQRFDLAGGHHNIIYSEGLDLEIRNKSLEVETFGIDFPRQVFLDFTHEASDSLKRFTEKIMNRESSLFTPEWAAVDPTIQRLITEITHCRYTGGIKKLFFLSKSIELLVLSAEAYSRNEKKEKRYIRKPADKEKMVAAKELVNQRLSSPPSLSEIARMVGTNEYKLKKGFRELFGNTVFGYLAEQRLELARKLLLETQKTAAEIAFETGYSTPQHFNNAFRKKFGCTPNSLRKTP